MPDIPLSTTDKALVAAILPVYNEGKHIRGVLNALHHVSLLREIIVVDDGSEDDSVEQILQAREEDPRIHLRLHPTNRGKGEAIFTGWRSTHSPYILLLDTDLHGLTPQHILDLCLPVLKGEADMTMGLFRKGRLITDLSHLTTPWLTGQRCLRAEILACVPPEAAVGYGFELALTAAAREHGYRIRRVFLKGVWHPPSEMHRGLRRGILWRAHMYAQIMRTAYILTRLKWARVKAYLAEIIST